MRYNVYFLGSKVKVPGNVVKTAKRKVWPKDTTELSFEIDGTTLYYEITNPSERTQYLFEQGKLGIGLIVEENPSWINKKWRSNLNKRNHLTRHCIKVQRVDSRLTGTINLNDLSNFSYYGCLSKQLYSVFNFSGCYQDPYVSDGTEKVFIGIGRMYDIDAVSWNVVCFRPYNVSDYVEIMCYNKI